MPSTPWAWAGRHGIACVTLLALLAGCSDERIAQVQRSMQATFVVSGKVTQSNNTPFASALVEAIDPATLVTVASATTSSTGTYSLSVAGGSYDFKVTPPPGSGFSSATLLAKSILANTTLDFVLVPAGVQRLSGYVRDAAGTPIPGINVYLTPRNGSQTYQATDATGKYSFDISPGEYFMSLNGQPGGQYLAPRYFNMNSASYFQLQGEQTMDIVLPVRKVRVQVLTPAGMPVPDVRLITGSAGTMIGTVNGINFNGNSETPEWTQPAIRTDAQGYATLYLFRSNTNGYSVTAQVPTGSPFGNTTLTGVLVGDADRDLTIPLSTTITISGTIRDAAGTPLSGQNVYLTPRGGSSVHRSTDANGAFSYSVAAGEFSMSINGQTPLNGSAPRYYNLNAASFVNVTGSKTLNIVLPAKRVDVTVVNEAGAAQPGVTLSHNGVGAPNLIEVDGFRFNGSSDNPNWAQPPIQTNASGRATLWLFALPTTSSYTISAAPPSGSPYGQATVPGVAVSGDRALQITLRDAITVSGRILDANNVGIPNQNVYLTPQGAASIYASTDAAGRFSFPVSAGNFSLSVNGQAGPSYAAPRYYTMNSQGVFAVNANMTFDLRLPVHRVDVSVQDPGGTGLPNVQLTTGGIGVGNLLNVNGVAFAGSSQTPEWASPPRTDAAGAAVLWLFSSGPSSYTITAKPPVGLPFGTINVSGVPVSGPVSKIIVLQFVHAPPVTTATISPAPGSDGKYSDPVSISLSATATSGYTVSNIYYRIDGGAQRIYAPPAFQVTGAGDHTVEYWAVDNGGVYEIAQKKLISIRQNTHTINFPALPAVTYGDAPFTVGPTLSSGLPLTITAAGACAAAGNTITITAAGECRVTASHPGDANYPPVSETRTTMVARANPALSWAAPASIEYGTPLSGTQLNAAANVAGSFAYAPAAGTVLNAGSHTLNATFTAGSPNYNGGSVSTTLVVSKRAQQITLPAIGDRTYGDPSFRVNAVVTSLLPPQYSASGACTIDQSGNVTITAAGACALTASQPGDPNHHPAQAVTQQFNIGPAALTVRADDKSRRYGEANPAFTASYTGFVYGQNAGVLAGTLSFTGAGPAADATTSAGDYAIVPAGLTSSNYRITFAPGVLQILKRDQTISFGALPARTFGDPAFELSATATSGLAVQFTAAGNCSIAGATVTITGAGSCTVSALQNGDANTNPAAPVQQSFTIAKAAATLALSDASFEYDGTPRTLSATVTPSVPGVVVSFENGAPVDAGSYTATATLNHPNYQAAPVRATLTITPTAPVMSWTAPAAITYGTPLGAAQLSARATFKGAAVAGTFAYSPTAGTVLGAGTHSLGVSFTPASGNFKAGSAATSITVNKAVLSVKADDKAMQYADPVPALSSSITGFMNGDNASVVSGTPALSTTATSNSAAGSYPISVGVSGLSAANYTFTGVNGSLIVSTRPADITYTGDTYALTAGKNVTSATINLGAQVTRVSGSAGNLSLATVTFKLYTGGSSTPSYTFSNVALSASGVAAYRATLEEGAYLVVAELNGNNYWTPSSAEGSTTIAVNDDDQRVSGGGWILDAGNKAHFGTNIKLLKNGNLKGDAWYAFVGSDGFTYKLTTVRGVGTMTFGLNGDLTRASFNGAVTIQKVNAAGQVVSTMTGYSAQIHFVDGDLRTPRTPDAFAITVFDANGAAWRSVGSAAAPVVLGGGNLDVKSR